MDALLGHPSTDPHGAPIPGRDGSVVDQTRDRLSDLGSGQRAVVAEVVDHDPALLRYLGGLGLRPTERIEVLAAAPFEGPLTLRVGEMEQIVGRRAAEAVFVVKIDKEWRATLPDGPSREVPQTVLPGAVVMP